MADYAHARGVDRLVRLALDEDLPGPDLTTEATGVGGCSAAAAFVARQACTLSGIGVAERVFAILDPAVRFERLREDGATVAAGEAIARVSGRAGSILAGERTALNFLQRLTGVATVTRAMVDLLAGLRVTLLDTRKTTPGWRQLEKAAVRDGGGTNHRFSLSDAVLIKDNHVRLAGGTAPAVAAARARLAPGTRIEVEADTLAEVRAALAAGADAILLDNADPATAREAALLVGGRAVLELSGGITAANLREMAATGADCVSCGALTHSAPAVDISLEFL